MDTKNTIIDDNIKIKILYSDNDLLVIDKPIGLVVNESNTLKSKSLQQILEDNKLIDLLSVQNYVQDTEYNKAEEFVNRQGIVHRLDSETSGILLIAKNLDSFIDLQSQFKSRLVKKSYFAIVKGKLTDLKINEEFTIDAPVGRNIKSRNQFAIIEEDGKEAVTDFKLLKVFNDVTVLDDKPTSYSVFECYPKTGRTHQIRVHLTSMNMPILGDKIYAGRKSRKIIDTRMFLHANSLKFSHPKTSKSITVESEMPLEFKELITRLEQNKSQNN